MNALPKAKTDEVRPEGRVIELFSPPKEISSAIRLPKPRPLMFDEVTETWGGYVLEAQIEKGVGPFKWVEEIGFLGGAWVARASARPIVCTRA